MRCSGGICRGHVQLTREVHEKEKSTIAGFFNRHVSSPVAPDRKLVMYHERVSGSDGLVKAMQKVAARADCTPLDVLSVNGEGGVIIEIYAARMFSSRDGSDCTNVGGIVATDSAACGMTSPFCEAVGQVGLCSSLADFAQKLGQAAGQHGEAPALPCEFFTVLSVTASCIERKTRAVTTPSKS